MLRLCKFIVKQGEALLQDSLTAVSSYAVRVDGLKLIVGGHLFSIHVQLKEVLIIVQLIVSFLQMSKQAGQRGNTSIVEDGDGGRCVLQGSEKGHRLTLLVISFAEQGIFIWFEATPD